MNSKKNPLIAQIWDLLTKQEKIHAIFLLGLMLLGTVLEALCVGLVVPTLTLILQGNLTSNFLGMSSLLEVMGASTYEQSVEIILMLLILTYLMKTLFLTFLSWFQMRFSFGVQQGLSKRIYESYLSQPYTFFLNRNSANLISIAINEVNLFVGNGILPAISLVSELLVIAALGFIIFYIEPIGSIVLMFGYVVAIYILIRFTKKRITNWGRERQQQEMLKLKTMQEGLGGIKEVIVLCRERVFLESFQRHNQLAAKVAELQGTMQKLPGVWIELIAVCGLLILVYIFSLQNSNVAIVIPTLGLFASAAFRLMPSVNRILASQHALHYVKPIVEVLTNEIKNVKVAQIIDSNDEFHFHQSIEIKNLTYKYDGATSAAIKNICLSIKKGESIGLLGVSGAGKSTFIDIFLGLLKPTSGEVLVDDVNIKKNMVNWRKRIGYVPQFIFLLDDSLRNNIAFGVSPNQIDDTRMQTVIEAAQLQTFIQNLPGGLDTMVGERGVRISGGQRQRIGIARALYHNPDVLILDEATSALDADTESGVIDAVNKLYGHKTIITIAHRLSTLKFCDKIFRLIDGGLVEISKKELNLNG